MGTPTVTADLSTITGGLWTAVISGIRDAHSVVIEAWGANGALSRIFPRGRDEMKVQLRFIMPGETTVSLTIRDNDLRPVEILELPVQVMLPGWLRGSAEPQRGFARSLSTRIPPMGLDKPPLVPLEGQTASALAGAAPRGERGDITAAAEAVASVGAPWKLHLGGLANVHSVVIELYGANGGLNRIFPRGRDAMVLDYAFAEAGATHVCVSARDASLRTTETLEFDIDVVPATMAGAAHASRGGPAAQPRPKSTPVAPMGVVKPPMATLSGHADRGGAVRPIGPVVQPGSTASGYAAPSGAPQVQPPSASTLNIADAMQKSIEDRIRNRTNRRDS